MLSQPETIKGIWWISTNPEKRLQGEITYGPTNGATVDIFGDFYDGFHDSRRQLRFVLHGETLDDKKVSLFDCIITSGTIHFPGAATCKIASCFGVTGEYYESRDEIKFKEVRARFNGLRNWVWTTGIKMTTSREPNSVSVDYKLPKLISLGEINGFSVFIDFVSKIEPGFNSFKINQDCLLLIKSEPMRSFSDFDVILRAFQTFLCLAIQHPTYCTEVNGHIDVPQMTIEETDIYEDFMIIRSITDDKSPKDEINPMEQLFTMPELTLSPAEVFGRFVERKRHLQASMDIYFSTVFFNRTGLPRITFLLLAQSIEGYHRSTVGGKYLNDEAYEHGIRKTLSESLRSVPTIEPDFRASLENKLKYLHEFSLKKRIKELARKHEDVLNSLIGDVGVFSADVSNLRNELTHLGPESGDMTENYKELLRLSEMMALLLETCFLDEIGFSREKIKEIVYKRSKNARRVHQGVI